MYQVMVVLAMSGLGAYFLFPIILAIGVFKESKGALSSKSLTQSKLIISLFGLIVGIVAVSSILVSFESEMNGYLRGFLILSSITYLCLTISSIKAFLKIYTSASVFKRSLQ